MRKILLIIIAITYAALLYKDYNNTHVDCTGMSFEQINFIESKGAKCRE